MPKPNQVVMVPRPYQIFMVPKPNQVIMVPKPNQVIIVHKPNQVFSVPFELLDVIISHFFKVQLSFYIVTTLVRHKKYMVRDDQVLFSNVPTSPYMYIYVMQA